MRTGNASEFGEVLTRHAAWAGEAHFGVGNLEFRGDSDSAWTAHQRGDDYLPMALHAHFCRTGRSFVIHRSPGGGQALSRAETVKG